MVWEARPEKKKLTFTLFSAASSDFAGCYGFAEGGIVADARDIGQTAAVDGWSQSDRYALLLCLDQLGFGGGLGFMR